jgi:hypothetical protein
MAAIVIQKPDIYVRFSNSKTSLDFLYKKNFLYILNGLGYYYIQKQDHKWDVK